MYIYVYICVHIYILTQIYPSIYIYISMHPFVQSHRRAAEAQCPSAPRKDDSGQGCGIRRTGMYQKSCSIDYRLS